MFCATGDLVNVLWKWDVWKCQNQDTPRFFDQLSGSSQLLWWFKSTWQKSIITRKPLHKLFKSFKLFKSLKVCNVFKVFRTFKLIKVFKWCWKLSPLVDYTAALSLPWGCRSSGEAETSWSYSLASSNHNIHWIVQIMIIFIANCKSWSYSLTISNQDHYHDRHLKDSHELLKLEHSLGKILLQHKSREFWDEDGQL